MASLLQVCLQSIAAALVNRHVRLHPILRNRENGLMLLPRIFKAAIGARPKDDAAKLDVLPRHHEAVKVALPRLCSEALEALK